MPLRLNGERWAIRFALAYCANDDCIVYYLPAACLGKKLITIQQSLTFLKAHLYPSRQRLARWLNRQPLLFRLYAQLLALIPFTGVYEVRAAKRPGTARFIFSGRCSSMRFVCPRARSLRR